MILILIMRHNYSLLVGSDGLKFYFITPSTEEIHHFQN